MPNQSSLPIAAGGVRFACTGCGKCCTGGPGYVWVGEEELQQLADHLKVSVGEVRSNYVRQVGDGDRYSLIDRPGTDDCIFLQGKQCSVYEARPVQCRTFPWWPENLRSKKDWEDTKLECEGIRDDAPIIPEEKILEQVAIFEEAAANR